MSAWLYPISETAGRNNGGGFGLTMDLASMYSFDENASACLLGGFLRSDTCAGDDACVPHKGQR